jgi:Na+/proline symporter
MGMTSSDVNTIAAVITRDILPVVSSKFRDDPNGLRTARITTFIFTLATIVIALNYERFGGVLGLIINWFAALLGPTALPLLFGLLPAFKSCGPKAAIASIVAGLLTFVIGKQVHFDSLALEVGLPTIVSVVVFVGVGLMTRTVPAKVTDLINALKKSS